jgi:hypothetical protein
MRGWITPKKIDCPMLSLPIMGALIPALAFVCQQHFSFLTKTILIQQAVGRIHPPILISFPVLVFLQTASFSWYLAFCQRGCRRRR